MQCGVMCQESRGGYARHDETLYIPEQMYQERQSPPSNEPSNGLSSQSSSSHGQSAQSWSYSNSWSSSYYKKPVEPKPLNRKNFTLRDQVWGVGDLLRVNFSRVEDKGAVNWTWQPQIAYDPETRQPKGFVDMHRPDAWGYVQLGGRSVLLLGGEGVLWRRAVDLMSSRPDRAVAEPAEVLIDPIIFCRQNMGQCEHVVVVLVRKNMMYVVY